MCSPGILLERFQSDRALASGHLQTGKCNNRLLHERRSTFREWEQLDGINRVIGPFGRTEDTTHAEG